MRIVVCIKHVPDPAAVTWAPGSVEIDDGVARALNPYDEHAVEAAVQLATEIGAEVTALTVGRSDATRTLERALALGAEHAVHVGVERSLDALLTARTLAAAIDRRGTPDIVFTGKESIDTNGGEVMYRLAALLGVPAVSEVVAVALSGNSLTVDRELEAGARQALRVPLPCVIGAGRGLNEPRYPTLPQMLEARKTPIESLDWDDLGITEPKAGTEVLELSPAVVERRRVVLEGEPEQAVADLIRRLREEARVL